MRRPTARRAVQALGVAVLAGSSSMLLLPGADASTATTTKVPVLQQSWFWETTYEQANPPVAPPAAPPNEPSGVPDGDLAVATTSNDGSSTKLSVLSFDVSQVPAGSTVNAFTFSLTLDGQPGATSFDTVGAKVVACLPTRGWPAAMPGDYTDAPSVECSRKVAPTVDGSTYTFKIPRIAQTWIDDQNLGVALVADPESATPFQLVFQGAKDVKADLGYTAAVSSSPASGGATSSPGGSGTSSGGSSGTTVPAAPAVDTAALPATAVGGATAAPPVAAPVVAATPAAPAAPAARTVAATRAAPALPSKGFWALGILLALSLLFASLVFGDPAPVARTGPPSRLDRVLRAQHGDVFSTPQL